MNPERDLAEETHPDYIFQVVKLMIWHVWDLAHRDKEPVPVMEALDKRVDIMRKTTLFDGRHPAGGLNPPVAEWDGLKAELEAKILAHKNSEAVEELEIGCWQILAPYLEPKLAEGSRQINEVRQRPYRCWTYDVAETKPQVMSIHFANAYQPDSPFRQHREELIATLLQMLRDASKTYPEVIRVECGSWLNKFKPFVDLFPPAWEASFVAVSDYFATYGWWGQYIDHRGAFHKGNGSAFRLLKDHPYTAGVAQCSLNGLIEHLDGNKPI